MHQPNKPLLQHVCQSLSNHLREEDIPNHDSLPFENGHLEIETSFKVIRWFSVWEWTLSQFKDRYCSTIKVLIYVNIGGYKYRIMYV